MTYDTVHLTSQLATAHWGWTIALFLWFVGLSGMGLVINYWLRNAKLMLISTVAVWVGTLLVMSHLARLLNLPLAVFDSLIHFKFNFGSWMFVGICILSIMCVWTFLQAWVECPRSSCPVKKLAGLKAWEPRHAINVVLGVIATAYSGFLLTQAVGVTLWQTAILPVLWCASGLGCALGLAEIMKAKGWLGDKGCWIGPVAHGVHIAEAVVLFAFITVALTGTPGQVAGASALVSGSLVGYFWGGAVFLGLVVPSITVFSHSKTTLFVAGAAAMIGALFLRAAVLFAGYYDPVWLP